jgi:hypothetical protein
VTGSPFRSRTALIVPLVLLTVSLLEEVVTYKVRQHVRDVHLRVAVILALNGAAFAAAANWLGPWLRGLLSTARRAGREGAGAVGLWVFYGAAYGALFWAYLVVERRGPGGLLPAPWR